MRAASSETHVNLELIVTLAIAQDDVFQIWLQHATAFRKRRVAIHIGCAGATRIVIGDWKQGLPGEPAFRMGLMLGRADYLRHYIKCQEMSGFKEYYAAGGYPEGPGYACLSLNPRSNVRMMNGYTDPTGFEVPAGEVRYDNREYPWGKYYPDGELEDFWRRAYHIWRDISLPDGSPPTFNDASCLRGLLSTNPPSVR